ncbi:Methyl-accepting chemotaxis protein McpB [compost metagenome]
MKSISFRGRPMSIRAKWSLAQLAVAIVPLLGVTIFLISYFGGVTREESQEQARQILQSNSMRIKEWLDAKTSAVQELAAKHKELDLSQPKTVFPVLQALEDSDKQTEGYSVIGRDGQLLNALGLTADMSKSAYFTQAKAQLVPAVNEMSYLDAVKKYIIPVIVPLTDSSKQFAGGIAFSVTPEVLTAMSKSIQLEKSGYASVVSGEGQYYAYPDEKRIGKKMADFASSSDVKAAVKNILGKENGSETYRENGNKVITYFEKIPGTDWRLLLTVPEAEIYNSVNKAQLLTLLIVLVAVIIIGAAALFLTRLATKPILAVSRSVTRLADGHLDERVEVASQDEIGRLCAGINDMAQSLSEIVGNIKSTASEVSFSSSTLLEAVQYSSDSLGQVASDIQETAAGMESQFVGVEQSARATEEMAVGVQRIAESSSTVSEGADGVAEEVDKGYVVIHSALKQMDAIGLSARQTADMIERLTRRSSEIGEIVHVISDIASQTSLLSLNASIEAARAGEHGRGFGVVAEEVKKLAEQTGQSVASISDLIREVQETTATAAASMTGNMGEIEAGIAQMRDAGESFDHIRASIREVSLQMQDVSATTEQISAGTEEINASMAEMYNSIGKSMKKSRQVVQSSQEQVALMAEMAISVQQMNGLMSELEKQIQRFA